MIISEVNALCNLLAKVCTFADFVKDGWYKSSTELATFQHKVESLARAHNERLKFRRKFGLSDIDDLNAYVKKAEQILSDEQNRAIKLRKNRLARLMPRAFPGRLTEILQVMETIVNEDLRRLKERAEALGFLEQNLNHTEIPLPFQSDRKYVPIAGSIAEVQTALENTEGSRVVIVHGDGGLGKTSLVKYIALHYQKMNREEQVGGAAPQPFPDGVFYLHCGKGASARINELEKQLLESLGFGSEARADNSPPEREGDCHTVPSRHHGRLRLILARRRTLIIVDDVHEREVLQRLLIPGDAVTYLITSRRRDIWPDRDVPRIQLKRPSPKNARKILAMYTEIPEDIKEIVDSIIHGVGSHPLMLANIGLAMGATGERSPNEWRRMAKSWQDELQQRDFKYGPVLYGESYEFSMGYTMNLMMETLEEGERSFLLLMSLLEDQWIPEVVVKLIRRCMEPREAYFDYRRYRDQLCDKSLLEVYSSHGQDCGPYDGNTECSQTYLAIHSIRALFIRKSHGHLDQLRSMAIRILEPPDQINDDSVNSSTTGRGIQGAIAATIDGVRSLLTWGSGPMNNRTDRSMINGIGGFGEVKNRERALNIIVAGMYIHKTLFDATGPDAAPCLDVSIIPRSVCADMDVLGLLTRARKWRYSLEPLVELLNPDGEEGWKQEAHDCATKIIVRFICRRELDDRSVAQLVRLQQTTDIICDCIDRIFYRGFWASEFVENNRTVSSAHPEMMASMLDIFYNDTTHIRTFKTLCRTLLGEFGVLDYVDEDTILKIAKVFMKMLLEDSSRISNAKKKAFLTPVFESGPKRQALVMCKVPNFWKGVVRFIVDNDNKQGEDCYLLDRMKCWSAVKSTASEMMDTGGAFDMLWRACGTRGALDMLGRAGACSTRSECELRGDSALHILSSLAKVASVEHKKIMCADRTGIISLLNMLNSNPEGENVKEIFIGIPYSYGPYIETVVDCLGNLAVSKEIQEMIIDLCPEVLEKLEILERSAIKYVRLSTAMGTGADLDSSELLRRVSRTKTIFNVSSATGMHDYNQSSSIGDFEFGAVLMGRFQAFLDMEMYKEALDVSPDAYLPSCFLPGYYIRRNEIIFAKAMVKDYTGALAAANEPWLELQQDAHSLACGITHGQRGMLTRLSNGSLAEALKDFDASLELMWSYFYSMDPDPDLITPCDLLVYIYHILKQRGVVKYLRGDDAGARADAQTAQDLQLRTLVYDGELSWDDDHDDRYYGRHTYAVKLLRLPADYLGFIFSF